MGAYCGAIWRCRYFWLSLVKMDLHSRYRGSALGVGWSLLQPLGMTVIFCAVFGGLFQEDARVYAPYVLTGLAFWGFLSASVLNGCQSFFQGESYIRQFPAPAAIYPLRVSLSAAVHLGLALLVTLGLACLTLRLPDPLALLSLVPTLVLLVLFGWSVSILAGLATVHFRDTRHLSEMALQAAFYLTPVVYRTDLLRNNGLVWLADWNPLVPLLTLLREPLVAGRVPDPEVVLKAGLLVGFLAVLAFGLLRRLEDRLIFRL